MGDRIGDWVLDHLGLFLCGYFVFIMVVSVGSALVIDALFPGVFL